MKSLLAVHPHVAAFVRTPVFYLVIIVVGFGLLWTERKAKLPRIRTRYVNARLIPKLQTVSMRMLVETEKKMPGWERHRANWYWFVELQLVNESDTPVTVEEVEACVKLRGGRKLSIQHLKDLRNFHFYKPMSDVFDTAKNTPIPSLVDKIRGVPLTKGLGYRGWLGFEIARVSQYEMQKPSLDIWLIDALEVKHHVQFRKKSDLNWDTSFHIIDESI